MACFEDFEVGAVERFGTYKVTREEVIEFAARYDPSPQHVDDGAAKANPLFGRISASGVHTIAMMTRMLVDHWRERGQEGIGSRGFSAEFLKPVFPGDTLRCRLEITDRVPSRSRPQLGAVHFRVTVTNQDEVDVLTLSGSSLHRRRTFSEADGDVRES